MASQFIGGIKSQRPAVESFFLTLFKDIPKKFSSFKRFGNTAGIDAGKVQTEAMPGSQMTKEALNEGIAAFKLLFMAGLVKSGSDARRLISQGGAYMNDARIDDAEYKVTLTDVQKGEILLRAGKKRYHLIRVE